MKKINCIYSKEVDENKNPKKITIEIEDPDTKDFEKINELVSMCVLDSNGIEQIIKEPKKQYKIISNKIKCNHCGDIIESIHRHDFKWCKCRKVSVDGGKEYLKRSFEKEEDYEELSETIEI